MNFCHLQEKKRRIILVYHPTIAGDLAKWVRFRVRVRLGLGPNILGRCPLARENKHRIGLDFLLSCVICTPGPKIVENTSTLYYMGCGHRFKLKQKIGTESSCAGSILFRFDPIPCLEIDLTLILTLILTVYISRNLRLPQIT